MQALRTLGLILLTLACLGHEALAIAPSRLARLTAERIDRVEEFREIRKKADALGLRVWLFGGTAASFLHYVRSDEATKGEAHRRYFDYEFADIFREGQDIDLVVGEREAGGRTHGGSEGKRAKFQSWLERQYPYLQGHKSKWEVRQLRASSSGKEALIGPESADFNRQHTDSQSVGFIEVTVPPAGEPVVRDARAWESTAGIFLRDAAKGQVTYLFSAQHEKTERFRAGLNPPIFSAVRCLIKAFQFGLKVSDEGSDSLHAVVARFNPKADLSPYVKNWLERNGPKLFNHAEDVARAWNELEALGLRKKLIALSDPSRIGTLGWWMDKEPLRDGADPLKDPYELGGPPGKTAKQLGITRVTHDTRDFAAYEAILRSPHGIPNLFISRPRKPGESGNGGLYTCLGERGGKGGGFPIHFDVLPGARENVDFVWDAGRSVLVWLTRDKLRISRDSLSGADPFTLIDYLGDPIHVADNAIKTQIGRRLRRHFRGPLAKKLNKRIEAYIKRDGFLWGIGYVDGSDRFPEWIDSLLERGSPFRFRVFIEVLRHPSMIARPEWPRWFLKIYDGNVGGAVELLQTPEALSHPEWGSLFEAVESYQFFWFYMSELRTILGNPTVIEHPVWGPWLRARMANPESCVHFLIARGSP